MDGDAFAAYFKLMGCGLFLLGVVTAILVIGIVLGVMSL